MCVMLITDSELIELCAKYSVLDSEASCLINLLRQIRIFKIDMAEFNTVEASSSISMSDRFDLDISLRLINLLEELK